jgi:hypothetical protein
MHRGGRGRGDGELRIRTLHADHVAGKNLEIWLWVKTADEILAKAARSLRPILVRD